MTLTDFTTIRLDRLELIVDATTNKIIYNFADSTAATATVATNVVTLSALQGGESNTDKLLIFYDAVSGDPTYDTPVLPNNAAKETGGNLATIATNTGNAATSTNQTNGSQQTKLTDGTNVTNVLKSDGTAAGQNAALIAPTYLSVPFTTTTAQAVASTDVGNYTHVSVQITGQGTSSVVNFQGSNDGTNWASHSLVFAGQVGASVPVTSSNTTNVYAGPLTTRYFRLNVTGISAGTTAGTVIFSTGASSPLTNQVSVTQSGTFTVQPGNTANTTAWLVTGTGGTFPATQSGTWTVQPGNTANTTPWYVKQQAQTTGGATPYQLISAATTNATNVKASAGTVYGIQAYNNSTTTNAYLKIYNKASAPTVGTDTPIKTILLPFGGGSNIPIPDVGIALGTGIAFAITGGMAVSDTTAVAATQVAVNIDYA